MISETAHLREALRKFNEQVEANLEDYERRLTDGSMLVAWEWSRCDHSDHEELAKLAGEAGMSLAHPYPLGDDRLNVVFYEPTENKLCFIAEESMPFLKSQHPFTDLSIFKRRLSRMMVFTQKDIEHIAGLVVPIGKSGERSYLDEQKFLAAQQALTLAKEKGYLKK